VPVGEVPEHDGDLPRDQQERSGGVDGRRRFGAVKLKIFTESGSLVAGPDRYLTVTKSSRAVREHDRGAREDGRVQKQQQDAPNRLAWGAALGRIPPLVLPPHREQPRPDENGYASWYVTRPRIWAVVAS
jgi:hypothetical protein